MNLNIGLLILAIVTQAIGLIFFIESVWISTLIALLMIITAVGPSIIGEFLGSHKDKGYLKPDKWLAKEFNNLVRSAGITRKVVLVIIPNWDNAESNCYKIKLGQIYDNQFEKQMKLALLAHELAHIQKKHYFKSMIILMLIPILVLFLSLLLLTLWLDSLPNNEATFGLMLLSFCIATIVFRFISWKFELQADLTAADIKPINKHLMICFLSEMAKISNMSINRDYYRHPSINKRIANLKKI